MSQMWVVRAFGRVRALRALAVAVAVAAFGTAFAGAAAAKLAVPKAAQGHYYRQGVVPVRAPGSSQRVPLNSPIPGNMSYGGGNFGVGVTTGKPQVYLIFWGTQWGTASTNSSGYATYSGDPKGMAPDLQAFFAGLGTNGETWSGIATQYCEGIAAGSKTCPTSAPHVAYPTGGALAGVWEDTASAAPKTATMAQIATEARRGALHFGENTQALNRDTQYFVVSPTGTHPDGFNTASGNFCAWHYYTGSSVVVAYTNMPYVTDAGLSCGQDFVNSGSAGTLDGVTIVGGHEYTETITDQFPAGGWTDAAGNESADKCAWVNTGAGASQDITLATGTFAVQGIWANDANGGTGGCEISHPIFGQTNTVSVTSPGNQTSTVGTPVNLQIQASDSGGATLTYSATGLPAGLSINASTGAITGTPTTPGTSSVTVNAGDTTGASGSASFSWTVNGGCASQQLLGNAGFETGSAAPWVASPNTLVKAGNAGEPAHGGSYDANLGGFTTRTQDMLSQTVTLPTGCSSYAFSYWLHVDSTESPSTNGDTLKAEVLSNNQTVTTIVGSFSNQNAAAGYQQYTVDLSAYAGQTVTLRFRGVLGLTGGGTTNFVVDDTALNVS
jgi:Putative Ig domain